MEATLHKNEFMPNLQRAQNVVQKRTAMPILGNVLLEALGDRIKMYATDLEVGIVEECAAKVQSQGTCTVGARKLFEIVKELPDKDIKLVKKDNVLEILCHSSTFRLRILPSEDFPRLPKFESSHLLPVPSAVFKDLIRNTIFSVSTDEMRYHLNGFLAEMENREGKTLLRMVSTDAHRLSVCERELPEGTQCLEELVRTEKKSSSSRTDVILPRKGVLEIGRMVEDGKGELLFGIDRTNAMVQKDGTTLVMRLIEGKFPEYRSVIPTKCDRSLTIEGRKLAESLRRMLTLSSEKSWGVHFHLKEGELTLSSSNPEFGEAEETLEVVYKGEPTRIGFNARYLLDILQVSQGDVTLEFGGEVQPCVIRSTADRSSLFIVMPMRL